MAFGLQKIIDRSLAQQMEDNCSRPPCSQIMHQVCVNKCGGTDRFSFGRKQIIQDLLFAVSINGVHLVMEFRFLSINCFVVWDARSKANAGMWVLLVKILVIQGS